MTIETSSRPEESDRLRSFLTSPARPKDTLNYNELKGFLFAMACSPEFVPPSDWLPMVFANEEANFKDGEEAATITHAIMEIYNEINQSVVDGKVELSASCQPLEGLLTNFSEDAPIGEWSRGFLHGHTYLEELWNEYTPDDLDEELGSCLMVLSFYADRRLAEAYHEDAFSGDHSFDQLAQEVLDIFNEAMASYAHIGRSIYLTLLEFQEEEEEEEACEFADGVKLGADDPCPCKSGKAFQFCCGGPKTVH